MNPERLKKGDKVALVATARRISQEEIAPTIQLLQSWGLEAVVPNELFAVENQMAGDDETRATVMQKMLDDESVKAIWCVRGGYGTVRIIDRLKFGHFARQPKWIIGYSDVTVLHSHIEHNVGIPTLHGTMPINIPEDATAIPYPAIESLKKALFEGQIHITFDSNNKNRIGEAEGVIVGGNLSILYSLCGSPSDIETDGKILFIEDLDEYLYHIDRMIQNLKRNGKLAKLKGLIVGAMSDMHDNSIPFGKSAEEIIQEAVNEYTYPVAFGAPIGHIGTENHALALGTKGKLSVGKDRCQISVEMR